MTCPVYTFTRYQSIWRCEWCVLGLPSPSYNVSPARHLSAPSGNISYRCWVVRLTYTTTMEVKTHITHRLQTSRTKLNASSDVEILWAFPTSRRTWSTPVSSRHRWGEIRSANPPVPWGKIAATATPTVRGVPGGARSAARRRLRREITCRCPLRCGGIRKCIPRIRWTAGEIRGIPAGGGALEAQGAMRIAPGETTER